MPSYREHYQEFLEAQLAAGGAPTAMTLLVVEYNNLDDAIWKPSHWYERWLRETKHVCNMCQAPVTPPKDVKPEDETCCDSCLSSRLEPDDDDSSRQDPDVDE